MRHSRECFNEELISRVYEDNIEEEIKEFLNYSTDELIDLIIKKLRNLRVKSRRLYLINSECKEFILLTSLKSSHLNQIVTDRLKNIEIPKTLKKLFNVKEWQEDEYYDNVLISYLTDINENGNLIFNLKNYRELLKYPRPILLDASHIFWDPRVNINKLLNNLNLLINLSPWLLLHPKIHLLIVSKADLEEFNLNYLEKFKIEYAGKVYLALIAYKLTELLEKNWKALYMKALSYASYFIMKLKNRSNVKVYTEIDESKHTNVVVIEKRIKIPETYCLEIFNRCFIYMHYTHTYQDVDILASKYFSNTLP